MPLPRLCKGCGDRSKPLNPSQVSDYHPACHPAGNKERRPPPVVVSQLGVGEPAPPSLKGRPQTAEEPSLLIKKYLKAFIAKADKMKAKARKIDDRISALHKQAMALHEAADKIYDLAGMGPKI